VRTMQEAGRISTRPDGPPRRGREGKGRDEEASSKRDECDPREAARARDTREAAGAQVRDAPVHALLHGMGALSVGDGQARSVSDRHRQEHYEPDDGQGRSGWDEEGEWLPEGRERCLHGSACAAEDEVHFWTVIDLCRPACARNRCHDCPCLAGVKG
jgi:hypothetical protein